MIWSKIFRVFLSITVGSIAVVAVGILICYAFYWSTWALGYGIETLWKHFKLAGCFHRCESYFESGTGAWILVIFGAMSTLLFYVIGRAILRGTQ